MLDTGDFVSSLINNDVTHVCVVPCSFATNLINGLINNRTGIRYLPCASEAVACSIAAGLSMSGNRPMVIAQSSGLANMGSCITSFLVPYGIRFPIIVSLRTYRKGDSEIQHAHLSERITDVIGSFGYEEESLNNVDLNEAFKQINSCFEKHTILILHANSFSDVELAPRNSLDLSKHIRRSRYLKCLNSRYGHGVACFVGTTGNMAREMYEFMPDTKNFYMVGNMGGALSTGLGSSLSGNRTIVCGGDAEFVMHLGGITTAGRYDRLEGRLTYIIFDNESNKSTGGQRTYQEHIDYLSLARASGFLTSGIVIDQMSDFKSELEIADAANKYAIHVKCAFDDVVGRPTPEVIVDSKDIFFNS